MKKFAMAAASMTLAASMAFAFSVPSAYAAKVDCDAVMTALNGGKAAKDVASDMGISVHSVYRCKHKAAKAAKAEMKATESANPAAAAAAPSMAAPPPAPTN
ncbi:MAG TPA: hypothetical protein VIX59_02820 [Candidatus Binataceae bacterium]|jgi:hypothetical protein